MFAHEKLMAYSKGCDFIIVSGTCDVRQRMGWIEYG